MGCYRTVHDRRVPHSWTREKGRGGAECEDWRAEARARLSSFLWPRLFKVVSRRCDGRRRAPETVGRACTKAGQVRESGGHDVWRERSVGWGWPESSRVESRRIESRRRGTGQMNYN